MESRWAYNYSRRTQSCMYHTHVGKHAILCLCCDSGNSRKWRHTGRLPGPFLDKQAKERPPCIKNRTYCSNGTRTDSGQTLVPLRLGGSAKRIGRQHVPLLQGSCACFIILWPPGFLVLCYAFITPLYVWPVFSGEKGIRL